jgi:hypothetical protein
MFEFNFFGYFRTMSNSRQDKPAAHAPSPSEVKPSPPAEDGMEAELEEAAEELAATFGAGPRAAPQPEGPMEGQQLSP